MVARAGSGLHDCLIDRGAVDPARHGNLRGREAMALIVSDLCPSARRIDVTKTWADHHGVATIDSSKNHQDRKVLPHRSLLPDLLAVAEGRVPSYYLFNAVHGVPLWPHNWRARVWANLSETTPFSMA